MLSLSVCFFRFDVFGGILIQVEFSRRCSANNKFPVYSKVWSLLFLLFSSLLPAIMNCTLATFSVVQVVNLSGSLSFFFFDIWLDERNNLGSTTTRFALSLHPYIPYHTTS